MQNPGIRDARTHNLGSQDGHGYILTLAHSHTPPPGVLRTHPCRKSPGVQDTPLPSPTSQHCPDRVWPWDLGVMTLPSGWLGGTPPGASVPLTLNFHGLGCLGSLQFWGGGPDTWVFWEGLGGWELGGVGWGLGSLHRQKGSGDGG